MAAASHDIKQPLFALGMLTDTLLMSDIPEDVRAILDKQRINITAMSEYFDALMDLGKFHGGSFDISYSELRLVDLASRISGEFSPLCADKGLEWHIDMVDAVIETDRELLLRLFRNLLSNALQFTSEGEIRCTATSKNGELEFVVADSGPGIAPAALRLNLGLPRMPDTLFVVLRLACTRGSGRLLKSLPEIWRAAIDRGTVK
jgi:signal transduction histidine kinase